MKCKICKKKLNKIYSSPNLPEYIWPSLKKSKFSKCIIFACKECYSLQLQNFSKKKIMSFYGNESFNILTKKEHFQRIKIIKKYYGPKFFNNKKIIDIGGGVNPILNKKKVDIYDFKISKDVRDNFKGNLYVGDIEKIDINKKYDIIFLLHTLEHLPNPLKALDMIKNILLKNGTLFIEVPNFDYSIKRVPHYAIFHQHLNMYNINNLKNLLNKGGLSIEKIFKKKNVIFCSIKIKKNSNKMLKVNFNHKIKILKTSFVRQRVKLRKFLKKNTLNIYGAGGSASLFLANHKFLLNRINHIYDNDKNKNKKIFPGTKKLIKKTHIEEKEESISFYETNKKNNIFINNL